MLLQMNLLAAHFVPNITKVELAENQFSSSPWQVSAPRSETPSKITNAVCELK